MSLSSNSVKTNFHDNLKEAVKTFVTLAVLIFFLITSFYILALLFPDHATLETQLWGLRPFIFGYIVAIPFMFILSLYPFGTN